MPRKQRRRTWGSITTVSRGKHVLRWVENTPEGRKRRSRTFYGTYKEADAELARIRVLVGDDAPVPTFAQIYARWWMPSVESRLESGDLAPNTHRSYVRAWERFCAPKWGGVPCDSVRPVEVQKWLDGMTAGNAAIASTVMKQLADVAVRYEIVETNKFKVGYSMPTRQAKRRSAKTYGLAEAESMLERVRGSRIEAAYILAAFGSCRTGEALAVKVASVHAVESRGLTFAAATVEDQMTERGTLADRTKNPQSARTVVVPPPYSIRLLEIASGQRAFGSQWMTDRGDGTPMGKGMLNDEWRRLAGSIRIPFSNLRPSWRTFAQAEWGVDYEVLEVLMGHLLQGVTGRHYLRMSESQIVERFAASYVKFVRS